ncbi:MAG TPA: hypothetical protein VG937_16645 [Polyangiaceae bacterium]|nr:hypothetical protein [Polyangiaceae bacterium]
MTRVRDEENQRIERLLTGGYLSGRDYDVIEHGILQSVAPASGGTFLRRTAPGAVAALSLAALVALLARVPSHFTVKGGESTAAIGALDVSCNRAKDHQCGPGDTLVFLVNSAVASGYLGAYAERVGEPSGNRIWYFPNTTGASPHVVAGAGTTVLPEGIRIGPEHGPGQYRLSVWLSVRPLARAEIDSADASLFVARSSLMAEVVP